MKNTLAPDVEDPEEEEEEEQDEPEPVHHHQYRYEEKTAYSEINESWYNRPLEEVDPLLFDETFCVIAKKFDKHYIYRFSSSKSLLLFGPMNRIRRFTVFITTHCWFDILMVLIILANCVTLAMITNYFDEEGNEVKPEYDHYIDKIEYFFLAVYTLEVILRVVAKGFVCHRFSYLRNRWNILDLIVVASGYGTIIKDLFDHDNVKGENELDFLRTFRVLRAIKTVIIFPGLKMMINALLTSIMHLVEVMAMTFVCLTIFTLFSQELFMGKLTQKCVIDKGGEHDPDRIVNIPIDQEPEEDRDRLWTEWVSDWQNWKRRDFPKHEPTFCGNDTSSRVCGPGYTCIKGLGITPDSGWTSFDNFFNAMLSTLQLLTLDFWERVYDIVVSTCGVFSLVFFLPIIFLGAYYLLNLMLAVVAMSYEHTAQQQGEQQELSPPHRLAVNRAESQFSFDELSRLNIFRMTQYRKRSNSQKKRLELRVQRAGIADAYDPKRIKENMHFDDAIFNLLGIRTEGYDPRRSFGPQHEEPEPEENMDEEEGGEDREVDGEDQKQKVRKRMSTLTEANNYFDAMSAVSMQEDDIIKTPSPTAMTRWRFVISNSMRRTLTPVVSHRYFEHAITFFIILNTVFLALEHHGASEELIEVLNYGNRVFLAVFTMECLLKLMALQGDYFKIGWNIFDMLVVLVSYIDVIVSTEGSSSGYSVIRSVRLLRVFKLAQSWNTMKVLLNIIYGSLGALGNLILVLLIVLYIFAVMGMQVIGNVFTPAAFDAEKHIENFPQWHWKHFWYAFMMVFRILCGEWIEPLVECLQAQEYHIEDNPEKHAAWEYFKCFIIYIPILIVGNFIVLNLFLALLLNSFDSEELMSQREKELDANGRNDNLKNIVGLLMTKKDSVDDGGVDTDEHDHDIKRASSQTSNEDYREKRKSHRRSHPKKKNSTALMKTSGIILHSPNTLEVPVTSSLPASGISAESVPSFSSSTGSMEKSGKHVHIHARTKHIAAKKRFIKAVNRVILRIRIENAERAIERMEKHLEKAKQKRARLFILTNPLMNEGGFNYDATPESSETSEDLEVPGDCCPPILTKCVNRVTRKMPRRQQVHTSGFDKFRIVCVAIVGHPVFENFIIISIIASSITLAFEDEYLDSKPTLQVSLCYLNSAFTGIFLLEMILKIVAIGAYGYFTSAWTLLDAFIVAVSLVIFYFDITLGTCMGSQTSGIVSNFASLKALRTLRTLRPLRVISRWEGMKIIVNALVYAIPSIVNVLLVCLLFWLVFSIMGVQFFKGQFYRCVNEEGERISYQGAPNKDVCCAKADSHGYSWVNTISNYDNVIEGYLSLFQIALFEGWMELMQFSVDAVGVDMQPIYDYQIGYYAYYVVFIVVGTFFVLQLFIGVIIDNFNMLKKKYEGNMLEVLLTPTQRNYYIAMKNLTKKKPKMMLKRPKNAFHGWFYDVAMSRRLEIVILVVICLNMVLEAIESTTTPQRTRHILSGISCFFATIYTLEAIIKIIGLRLFYFTIPWNVYDFVLVIASLSVIYLEDLSLALPLPPTMLRIVRIIRIGKLLRLVKSAQGIRKLLQALVVSIPSLFNIAALLALITYIYAILGMFLIGKAPREDAIDDVFNFETFLSSCLVLIRLMTAAGWNEVLDSLTPVYPVCGTFRNLECGEDGEPECPNRAVVVAYIVTYLIITYLIVINLYIAVILENYVEACNDEDVGIVEGDLDMFYNNWCTYDPYATQFIDFNDLSELLDRLDPPLQIPKPNVVAIVSFNLPIARGNKVHCLDILQALIQHVLGPPDDSREFRKMKNQMEVKFQKQFPTRHILDIVSSSRQWKIEQNAALAIQRAWRAYKSRKNRKNTMVESKSQTKTNSLQETKSHGGLGHMMGRLGNVKKDPSMVTTAAAPPTGPSQAPL